MLENLKRDVFDANLRLVEYNLIISTWGNVSGIDRDKNLVVIKPSGVDYDEMTADDMVVVDMNGNVVEGELKPSSDTPTHIELYKAFPGINGITHSHSTYATVFAQALMEIPCLGTTHADNFYGSVPLTRFLTEEEVMSDYEKNTGLVIIERLAGMQIESAPGILVAGHGPFCWGKSPAESVEKNLILEKIAEIAFKTLSLNKDVQNLPDYILNKHFMRKHGPNSYYGQMKQQGEK
ncbi:L-ribulose-5-phosphate 4-epimerase [Melioribacter roseus P3M-2]|uniref:L-ribulose-5-phosphate 4-epimerase n=1 Tax=Melioribacter roseus (strain DSM 23840 / JCM 17771 / VKM B-2668 / P3M-2) TaxID=1191523 RepID=I6ZW18_MELRP|nr:L-ribulose-5-phosphate 4-epimerase [Melioribacter roseus]AFN73273.1 L-ribulose-5-phosphate 4-epimerase [Melioribacter roseus P3M-2]